MCDPIISIKRLLSLSDKEYAKYVTNLLKGEGGLYRVDELDDALLEIVHDRPLDVERVCRINSTVFSKYDEDDIRTLLLAYNYNTLLAALLYQGNVLTAKSVFVEGITFCKENNQYEAGKSLSLNALGHFQAFQLPHDEAMYLLTQVTDFYVTLEKYQDIVEVLCAAALQFSEVSAFQSAYRATSDAQEIVRIHGPLRSQLRILETQGRVALAEGDLACAEAEFKKCFTVLEEIKEAPSFELRANSALVKSRSGDCAGAKAIYEGLVNEYAEKKNTEQIQQVRLNLLICYRQLGDAPAVESLIPRIESDLVGLDRDVHIEARLILARTQLLAGKPQSGIGHLKQACIEVQEQLDQYQRLHYRRGIREQYVSRIRSMLGRIGPSGSSDDVLHALVLCSSNGLLDWLSGLEWIDMVQMSDAVPDSLKEALNTKRDELIGFGTPFLYGFREKYDDPFQFAGGKGTETLGAEVVKQLDYSLPWREFNELTSRIHQEYGFPPPFQMASVQTCVELLHKQLSSGSALLFAFACSEACVLVLVVGNQYFQFSLSLNVLKRFVVALLDYQSRSTDRNTFMGELEELSAQMQPAMSTFVGELESRRISELVFVPDQITEAFPILPALLDSETLRSRVRELGFTFRTCPALKRGMVNSGVTGPSVGVTNRSDELKLSEEELTLVRHLFPGQEYSEINLQSEEIDFSTPPLSTAHLLHVAKHCVPAGVFTDPAFVSTSTEITKNSIWLDSVQREAHKLQFSLVVLNGCNSGSTTSHNYFTQFITSEKIGLSSCFLLNAKSVVVAAQWNVPDVVGYLFSALFYRRLIDHPWAVRAFILALADMYELTKEQATVLLDQISSEARTEERSMALRNSQNEFPCRNVYCLGMYQCHSLLS